MKPKTFFEHGNIRIHCDDFLKTEAIEPNSIDLIVTSPPYDVDIKYENYDDSLRPIQSNPLFLCPYCHKAKSIPINKVG